MTIVFWTKTCLDRVQARQSIAQTKAARDTAKSTAQIAKATWLGVVLNALIVTTALSVPAVQRSWSNYDQILEQNRQDYKAVLAGMSRLKELSSLTSNRGILEMSGCTTDRGLNGFDITRVSQQAKAMQSLNQFAFQSAADSPIQINEQAAMFRSLNAVNDAITTMGYPRNADMKQDVYEAYCRSAIADVVDEAASAKEMLQSDIDMLFKPISEPLFWHGANYMNDRPTKQDMLAEIAAVKLPPVSNADRAGPPPTPQIMWRNGAKPPQ